MNNHVSMEQRKCIVCCEDYDTGSILLATKYKRNGEPRYPLKDKTVIGWGMCPEHKKLKAEYVALVECDPTKSGNPSDTVKPEDAYRTGRILHIKYGAFSKCFNVPIPKNGVCFIEPGVFDTLAKRAG